MTWGVVGYGLLTDIRNACWLFDRVNPGWTDAAIALSGTGLVLSVVNLIRRDFIGIFVFFCSLAVLSGVWARFIIVGQ